MSDNRALNVFEEARPRLLGLAYRILGSMAEAEDIVQDVYLKWAAIEWEDIKEPDAWLTTVCTRRCLDILKSADKARVDYVGPWLPEPVHTHTGDTPEDRVELASSLTTAFLLLLDRLSPKERAAYLLYEIFDYDYQQVAFALDLEQAACRKLVSRARQHVAESRSRFDTPKDRQKRLLSAFQDAVSTGSVDELSKLLSDDVIFYSDGGGKAVAARRPVGGIEKVLIFLQKVVLPGWAHGEIEISEVNGVEGIVVRHQGGIVSVATFDYDKKGVVQNIYVVRNPDKLAIFEKGSVGNQMRLI